MVHWTTPRTRVDSYRIIYLPLSGGEFATSQPETKTRLQHIFAPSLPPSENTQTTRSPPSFAIHTVLPKLCNVCSDGVQTNTDVFSRSQVVH